jgi:poly(3-hydroxybutyrate) depolymerase
MVMPISVVEELPDLWNKSAKMLFDLWRGVAQINTPMAAIEAWNNWLISQTRLPPTWATPNEIVLMDKVGCLRDFSAGSTKHVIPTLVLPPQAGHDSCIVDFAPEQSQIRTIYAAGLERLYSFDWAGATYETRDITIDDYLDFIERSIDSLGGKVNLIGDCQGGWLATIYAALHPEQVNSLTIGGAPVDFHAGEPAIIAWVNFLPSSFYHLMVSLGGGILPGEFMLAGFIGLQPSGEFERYGELIANLRNPEFLKRYNKFEDWFKHTQGIPGAFYLWIVDHLFRNNELINGRLEIGGQIVDVARITCPLQLLGGATDHITPADQVFALADYASTPATQVNRRQSPGGHLGLFMGHQALREEWPPLLAEVLRYSQDA